jgi:hypothetical protein
MNPSPPGHDDQDLVDKVVAGLVDQPDPMARYRALSRAQEMYEGVTRRIAAERARAVADMRDAGLSYGQIAEAIGFTRARAQQLADRAVPAAAPTVAVPAAAETPALTAFLELHLRTHDWPREPQDLQVARSTPVPPLMAQRYTAETLAAELFADAGFRALQLGTWSRIADPKKIANAVDALAERPYRQDAELLGAAIELAAQLQQDDGRRRAVAVGLIAAFVGALALGGRD